MNTDRDKYLTEAMGEKFLSGTWDSQDFSRWDTFGDLFEWAQEQEWWCEFRGYVFKRPLLPRAISCELVHPDRFSTSVYQFLKGRES